MIDIVAKVLEDSVVAGGFILLLYHVLKKQDELLQTFANELKASNATQQEISKTLLIFNDRLSRLESKGDE